MIIKKNVLYGTIVTSPTLHHVGEKLIGISFIFEMNSFRILREMII